MKKIIIQGCEVTTQEELHSMFQQKLGLEKVYFTNLDTLRDGLMWHVPVPITVEWTHYAVCRDALGAYADQVLNVLYEVQEQLEELFTIQMKL
ncbi:barstar family protein [Paenibacillus barcinonensis]|uniref:Barstar family protein n=1 Tax=Paenibacillus barcinonensis TaxID=198119 RepID=A0A2V4VJ57_PAEBA|nr:barstar family protein [Paenibacillus barcinonensis]PYE49184.1 RNAse (barnase) inhibitor barstar [Paenibacillus barcinonensis]QKS55419.1 barstar family protein [Paenibacillus barcinonensis]